MASVTHRPNRKSLPWLAQIRKQGVSESRSFATKKEAQSWAKAREKELTQKPCTKTLPAIVDEAPKAVSRYTLTEAIEIYRAEVLHSKSYQDFYLDLLKRQSFAQKLTSDERLRISQNTK